MAETPEVTLAMGMKGCLGAVLFFTALSSGLAQSDFSFSVFDETKTDRLNYELEQDISLSSHGDRPRLWYRKDYRIYGINQDRFTFATETCDTEISPEAEQAFLQTIRALPTQGFDQKGAGPESSGWIDIGDRRYFIKAPPSAEIRRQWQPVLDAFLKKYAPPAKREIVRQTIEGETVPPVEIDFPTLLKNPQAFDGNRIRITGYYHSEFECSSFAASKDKIEAFKEAVWLGGPSVFANPKNFKRANNKFITVKGTFSLGPGGHLGGWMGEINRLTFFRPAPKAK